MSTTIPTSPYKLSLATASELPAIIALQYEAVPQPMREAIMGCKTEADIPRYAARWAERQRTEQHSVWIKVVDSTTSEIVAASNWSIFPNHAPDSALNEGPQPWLEGSEREASAKINDEFNAVKRTFVGGFVHLRICFTDQKYRSRGIGMMMMEWGNNVADALGIPSLVGGTPQGALLYKKAGYVEIAKMPLGVTAMRRDARC